MRSRKNTLGKWSKERKKEGRSERERRWFHVVWDEGSVHQISIRSINIFVENSTVLLIHTVLEYHILKNTTHILSYFNYKIVSGAIKWTYDFWSRGFHSNSSFHIALSFCQGTLPFTYNRVNKYAIFYENWMI